MKCGNTLLHTNNNRLLGSSFFRFCYSDWIFKLGPIVNDQYEYSIVSDNAGLGLFVLARDVPRFNALYKDEVLEYLQLTGFVGQRAPIEEYHGPDCEYPPFPLP